MSMPDYPVHHQETAEPAAHEHFAVREVDQLQDPVDQRVTEGYEGVHRTLFEPDDDVLGKLLQPVFGCAHARVPPSDGGRP